MIMTVISNHGSNINITCIIQNQVQLFIYIKFLLSIAYSFSLMICALFRMYFFKSMFVCMHVHMFKANTDYYYYYY